MNSLEYYVYYFQSEKLAVKSAFQWIFFEYQMPAFFDLVES